MRQDTLPFADVSSLSAGPAIFVAELREKVVQIYGTFTATAVVEASLDGSNFSAVAAGLTAPGFVSVPFQCKWLRVNVNQFSTGTVQALVAGLHSRTF